jgi:hypothetical protein
MITTLATSQNWPLKKKIKKFQRPNNRQTNPKRRCSQSKTFETSNCHQFMKMPLAFSKTLASKATTWWVYWVLFPSPSLWNNNQSPVQELQLFSGLVDGQCSNVKVWTSSHGTHLRFSVDTCVVLGLVFLHKTWNRIEPSDSGGHFTCLLPI